MINNRFSSLDLSAHLYRRLIHILDRCTSLGEVANTIRISSFTPSFLASALTLCNLRTRNHCFITALYGIGFKSLVIHNRSSNKLCTRDSYAVDANDISLYHVDLSFSRNCRDRDSLNNISVIKKIIITNYVMPRHCTTPGNGLCVFPSEF